MAKETKASKALNVKARLRANARKSHKELNHDLAKSKKSLQPVKAFAVKTPAPKTKKSKV